MHSDALLSSLESLLFVSGEPLSYDRISKILHLSEPEIRMVLDRLAERYLEDQARGLMITYDDTRAMLVTKPENALIIEDLTKTTMQETMSKAALEVLAIIAYRAPISRVAIDSIRGVNCSFTLRNLLLRDLISREGDPSDNRGYLYRPTLRFLQTLGLQHISELPSYEMLARDERLRVILENDGNATSSDRDSSQIKKVDV